MCTRTTGLKTLILALLMFVPGLSGYGCQQGPPHHQLQWEYLNAARNQLSDLGYGSLEHKLHSVVGSEYVRVLPDPNGNKRMFKMSGYAGYLMGGAEELLVELHGLRTEAQELNLYSSAAKVDGEPGRISEEAAWETKKDLEERCRRNRFLHRNPQGVRFTLEGASVAGMLERIEVLLGIKGKEEDEHEQLALLKWIDRNSDLFITEDEARKALRKKNNTVLDGVE